MGRIAVKGSIRMFGLLALVVTGCSAQSISFVQGGKSGYSESSHVACAAETNALNHLLLAAVYSTSNSVTFSVSDTVGNTWNALPADTSSYGQIRVYYAIAKATGSNTISANQSSSTATIGLFCSEWSGNATSGVLDVQTAANASKQTASMSSGNLTTTGSSDLLYCLFADEKEGAMTVGTGFTEAEIDTGFGALSEYERNLTAGVYSCNGNDTAASSYWLAYAVAFKASSSSPTLQSVSVAPSTASVPVAGTQPFTATGHYSDGSTTNLTSTATWSASGSTGGGGGTFSFVQGGKTGYSESAHVACAAKDNTANNLLLAAVYSTSNSVSLSVNDTMGNIWTALPTDSSSNGQVQIFYAVAKSTASNTISANQTSSAAIFGLFCSEWSGNATSGVLDVQTSADASKQTASMSSGNMTTTGSADLLYCLFADEKEGAMTIGTGFTEDEIDTGFGALSEYSKNLSAGTYSCNAGDTAASNSWLAYAAAFKAGGGSTAVASVNSTGLATGLAAGASTITATVTGISGSATLTVTSGGGGNPAPTVTAISPISGTTAGGTAVTITGTGFVAGATVTLGDIAATNVTVVSSTSITATTPADAAGTVNVIVTSAAGQSGTLSNGFTYGNSAPTVTAISPALGTTNGGTLVTLTGTNFVAGMIVTIGGVEAAEPTVASSTSITATTPIHAAGAVSIVATNLSAESATLTNGFTYTAGGPTINFVQVAAATPQVPESTVTVAYPLSQTPSDLNVVVVGWNDTTATVQSVKDSAGNSYSLAAGLTNGTAIRQSIYYAKNILGGINQVTVVFSPAAAYPDIRILEYSGLDASSPLDVSSGASGNSATASSGAVSTTAANELIFGADTVFTGDKTPGTGFTTRIITAPDSNIAEDRIVSATGSYSASATLTSSGPWVMQMATFKAATGTGTLAPTITSVFPSSGGTNGGTVATITGTNFAAGATVTFGGVAATDVVVASSTMITAVTPSGSAGAVTVGVTVNSAAASLVNGFTYASNNILASGPLKVSSTNPRYFADGTGNAIYLTGAHTWQDNVDGWGIPNDCPVPPAFDWTGYLNFVQAHQYNWIRLWTWDLPTSTADAIPVFDIATLSRVSDVVTVTTSVANSFVPGDLIAIGDGNGLPDSGSSFVGRFVVSTVPVPGSQFTFEQVAANASTTGGTASIVEPECHLPVPYLRTGSGDATDGLPKFDLTQLDQSFFDRLRQRVIDAGQLGIYVSVMLFDGHGVQYERLATDGYWFTGANNINGIDDAYVRGSSSGFNSTTLLYPAITAFQDAYVRKVIDSVNDLDNVMYEVANEANGAVATGWESHVIDLVHQYEAGLPKQHPVGFTCEFAINPSGDDTFFTSDADWVAPCGSGYGYPVTETSLTITDTKTWTGNKVVIDDTDHSWFYTEILSATKSDPNAMREWAWENFTRGANTAFMDPYLVVYPGRNAPSGTTLDPQWNVMRTALSQTAAYAKRIDLGQVIPQNSPTTTIVCSTLYCLIPENPTSKKQFLIYSPTGKPFTVQLAADTYSFEWFNPAINAVAQTGTITIPSSETPTFTPPFTGPDAVLLLLGN
jgi:hypothetical protein